MLQGWKARLHKYLDRKAYPSKAEEVDCPHPDCTRSMLFRDVFEHFFITHINLREKLAEEPEQDNYSGSSDRGKVRKRDLLDNYELDREQDLGPDNDVDIQEATGGGSSRTRELRKYYKVICNRIEEEGELVIKENTHIGSTRGGHIKTKFKQAVRRVEGDSLENYRIENDGNGSYPIIIHKV